MGANCVALQDVRIRKNSVIGTGSVITKDIPTYYVAVGNPAEPIKEYNFGKGKWIRVVP